MMIVCLVTHIALVTNIFNALHTQPRQHGWKYATATERWYKEVKWSSQQITRRYARNTMEKCNKSKSQKYLKSEEENPHWKESASHRSLWLCIDSRPCTRWAWSWSYRSWASTCPSSTSSSRCSSCLPPQWQLQRQRTPPQVAAWALPQFLPVDNLVKTSTRWLSPWIPANVARDETCLLVSFLWPTQTIDDPHLLLLNPLSVLLEIQTVPNPYSTGALRCSDIKKELSRASSPTQGWSFLSTLAQVLELGWSSGCVGHLPPCGLLLSTFGSSITNIHPRVLNAHLRPLIGFSWDLNHMTLSDFYYDDLMLVMNCWRWYYVWKHLQKTISKKKKDQTWTAIDIVYLLIF